MSRSGPGPKTRVNMTWRSGNAFISCTAWRAKSTSRGTRSACSGVLSCKIGRGEGGILGPVFLVFGAACGGRLFSACDVEDERVDARQRGRLGFRRGVGT